MKIAVLAGDGIGPEVAAEGVRVLKTVSWRFNLDLEFENALIGGCAYDATGDPLPEETLKICRDAGAVFMGAVGGPAWDNLPAEKRPEAGLLKLRKTFALYANIRPVLLYPELAFLSCLRQDLVKQGVDFVVVRELTGGVYFGRPAGQEQRDGLRCGFDTMIYNEEEVRRIARVAFTLAGSRRSKICSVDKANVLHSSRLWRAVVNETAAEFPEVELSHMYVDNAAMQIVSNPGRFDVMLCSNLFGDILSDEASALTGSLGLLPSASLGETQFGVYEPCHGSAPDMAGQDTANPIAAILSAALLLRLSLQQGAPAVAVEKAVRKVLASGLRTQDLVREGESFVGCRAMGEAIAKELEK
ncbi:MAG: 3-isopropylmalate dehydrogenase [Deltaproteobacteria bacterium]|jgi:3-isopropylmalate dehydrogenase|nr:3-isopropylmalate dehydrogenase [Deltaproteobacteria bacterium]